MKIYKAIYFRPDIDKENEEEYFDSIDKAISFLSIKVNKKINWLNWFDSIYANIEDNNGDEVHICIESIEIK